MDLSSTQKSLFKSNVRHEVFHEGNELGRPSNAVLLSVILPLTFPALQICQLQHVGQSCLLDLRLCTSRPVVHMRHDGHRAGCDGTRRGLLFRLLGCRLCTGSRVVQNRHDGRRASGDAMSGAPALAPRLPGPGSTSPTPRRLGKNSLRTTRAWRHGLRRSMVSSSLLPTSEPKCHPLTRLVTNVYGRQIGQPQLRFGDIFPVFLCGGGGPSGSKLLKVRSVVSWTCLLLGNILTYPFAAAVLPPKLNPCKDVLLRHGYTKDGLKCGCGVQGSGCNLLDRGRRQARTL